MSGGEVAYSLSSTNGSSVKASGPGVKVKCFKNLPNQQDPKWIVVPNSLEEFLKIGGKKVGVDGKYAYTAAGALVDDVDLLREEEEIYISERQGFYRYEGSGKRFKIAVLGPGGVGKSCLTIRYTKSTFVESYDPTIEDAFRHQTVIDDRVVVMEILDTAGQEEFKCLSPSWVEGKDGFLLVFNICDPSSFQACTLYYKMIVKEAEQKQTGRPPIILIGNKSDLPEKRKTTTVQGQERATSWTAQYIETSARTGSNVDKAFEDLIRLIRQKTENDLPPIPPRRTCFFL